MPRDIKDFKKRDAVMLRDYCIRTIEDPDELTKNKRLITMGDHAKGLVLR